MLYNERMRWKFMAFFAMCKNIMWNPSATLCRCHDWQGRETAGSREKFLELAVFTVTSQ